MKYANMLDWLMSRIHSNFTLLADDMIGQGCLNQDERKALSAAIGKALDAFEKSLGTDMSNALRVRSPYENAPMVWNTMKAVSKTDDELRVANYMILFGGRDLEGTVNKRKNLDGSAGEYFTNATKFDSDYTQLGQLYIDWEHSSGIDGNGPDDILGYVDWKSAQVDEKGVFVERVLNRRNKYVRYIEDLIEAGLIGNSTEAVSAGVVKAANGEIQAWPLKRDSLTVMPMEPRMITQNTLIAVKAMSEYSALTHVGEGTKGVHNSDAAVLAQIEFELWELELLNS